MSVKTVPGALDILNQKLGGNAGDIPASSTKEYALEKIYKQLGGTESLDGVNTTAEIIEKIAGVAQGGGGSSDFSTAEVTFTGSTTQANIVGAFFGGNGDNSSSAGSVIGGNITQGAENLVLYKGMANVTITDLRGFSFNNINATGNVQEITTNMYLVTGDCNFEILE